ncbi:hypothetical protein QTH91_09890 [Variovorax dokdonensis]|uniref:Uncharacterized protein n=1 Tax=Variovorax dokdonensis TaxID=344883 RepID=A0ABT7NA45_9BURK|nr:hypothetical protein [Variovorax dokdonensis]MDM0044793.1 hypothetical protein [Variovorax dokdonensis]
MDKASTWIRSIRDADASRPDFPGEHIIVLGVGLALMAVAGSRNRSLLGRALIGAVAGAFIGRAASGSGGVARIASLLDAPRRRY